MLVIVKLGSRSEYFTLTVSARVELVTGQGESFSQKLGPGVTSRIRTDCGQRLT